MISCTECRQEVYETVGGFTSDEDDEDMDGYTCPETGMRHMIDEEDE
jgi:hypothetical protein